MCTLTVVPLPNRLRLVFNRDELRTRAIALPPQQRRLGGLTGLLPIDPFSEGSWLGINEAGLILALLNVNPLPPRPTGGEGGLSRGLVIPALLRHGTLEEALDGLGPLTREQFRPFRLIAIQHQEIAEVRFEEGQVRTTRGSLAAPLLFTSWGLGDALAEEPRRRLFEEMLGPGCDLAARQDAFHRHSWPERPHLSVCMRRADACTVSCTTLDIHRDRAVMTYHPGPPDEATVGVRSVLSFPQVLA